MADDEQATAAQMTKGLHIARIAFVATLYQAAHEGGLLWTGLGYRLPGANTVCYCQNVVCRATRLDFVENNAPTVDELVDAFR